MTYFKQKPIKHFDAEYHNVIPFQQATSFMDKEKNQKLYNLGRGDGLLIYNIF